LDLGLEDAVEARNCLCSACLNPQNPDFFHMLYWGSGGAPPGPPNLKKSCALDEGVTKGGLTCAAL